MQPKNLISLIKPPFLPCLDTKLCTYIENSPADLAEDACEAPPAWPGGLRRPEGQRDQQQDVRNALVEDEGVGHGPGGLSLQPQGGHEESVPQQAQHGQQREQNWNPDTAGMFVVQIILVLVAIVVVVAAILPEQSVQVHLHIHLHVKKASGQVL